MTMHDLTATALKLPPKSRARLAARLLESIDARSSHKTDAVWAKEVEARIDAHERTPSKTIPASDVIAYTGK